MCVESFVEYYGAVTKLRWALHRWSCLRDQNEAFQESLAGQSGMVPYLNNDGFDQAEILDIEYLLCDTHIPQTICFTLV